MVIFYRSGYWYHGVMVDTIVVHHLSMFLSLITHPVTGVSAHVQYSKQMSGLLALLTFDASNVLFHSFDIFTIILQCRK
jgi:hypothetical protein